MIDGPPYLSRYHMVSNSDFDVNLLKSPLLYMDEFSHPTPLTSAGCSLGSDRRVRHLHRVDGERHAVNRQLNNNGDFIAFR